MTASFTFDFGGDVRLLNANRARVANLFVAVTLSAMGLAVFALAPAKAFGVGAAVQFGVPVPIIGTSATRVSCPSATKCVSVDNPDVSVETEANGVWTGSNYSIAGGSFLTNVSCPSTTECLVVGYNNANSEEVYSVGVLSGVNQTWTWSASADIPPDSSTEGQLYGLSCPSTTVCIATGADAGGQGVYVVGSGNATTDTWTWTTTPVGDGSTSADEFFGVSCPTTALCVADGLSNGDEAIYATGTYSGGTGWTWANSTEVTPDGSGGMNAAADISCASAVNCVGVGTDKNGAPVYFAGSYAGGSWTWTAATALPVGTAVLYEEGVSCGSSTSCVAVGYDEYGQGSSTTGTLSGGSWSWSALDGFAGNVEAHGVYCLSATTCALVGEGSQAVFEPSIVEPGAPSVGTATSAYESATVSWSAGNAGYGTITGYVVDADNTSTNAVTDDACPSSDASIDTSCVVTGLTENDSYTFSVAETNQVGESPFSNPSNVVVPSSQAPGVPSIASVSVSGRSATVQWTPGITNGSPITGYVVHAESTATNFTVLDACPTSDSSSATECTLNNLVNGSSYVFSVAAINNYGTGFFSSPSSETPIAGAPLNASQSPLTITTTTGPAFNGATSSSLILATSGGSVSGLDAYAVGGAQQMTVFNTATNAVTENVNFSPAASPPLSVAVNPAGTFAYIAGANSNEVTVVNTLTDVVVAAIPVGTYPSDIAINPAGTYAYVTNFQSSNVSVINLQTDGVTTLDTGNEPNLVKFTPSGNQAVVLTESATSVSIINTATEAVSNVDIPADPTSLAINPTGTLAYVTSGVNQLSVIDLSTDTLVTTVTPSTVGLAASVVINPSGQFVYVLYDGGESGPGTVRVVETSTNTVVDTVDVDNSGTDVLGSLTIDPSGSYLFVGPQVINLNSNTLITTVQGWTPDIFFNASGTVAYSAGGGTSIAYMDMAQLQNPPLTSGPMGFIFVASDPNDIALSTPATSYVAVDGTAAGCNVVGSTLTATSPGSCVVTATMAGDNSYAPATSGPTTVTFPSTGSLGSGGGSGGSGSGAGGGGGGGPVASPPSNPSPPSTPSPPAVNVPVPREVTYSGTGFVLSAQAKVLLSELVRKLVRGASVSVVGYAHDDSALARKRALVVVDFLKSRIAIHVIWRAVTDGEVGRVTVTTLKL